MILVRYVSAAIRGRRKVVLTEPVPDEATAASDPIRQKITHLAGDFVVRKDADIISTYRRKLGPRVSVVDHGKPTVLERSAGFGLNARAVGWRPYSGSVSGRSFSIGLV
jgi:hypothetical protein